MRWHPKYEKTRRRDSAGKSGGGYSFGRQRGAARFRSVGLRRRFPVRPAKPTAGRANHPECWEKPCERSSSPSMARACPRPPSLSPSPSRDGSVHRAWRQSALSRRRSTRCGAVAPQCGQPPRIHGWLPALSEEPPLNLSLSSDPYTRFAATGVRAAGRPNTAHCGPWPFALDPPRTTTKRHHASPDRH